MKNPTFHGSFGDFVRILVHIPGLGTQLKFKFIKTIADYKQAPPANMPEVLIVGRSNSGKSSLINRMANQKIAYVSSTPGRTALLNFYESKVYRLVDSPGYGFSKGRKNNDETVFYYATMRSTLKGILLLMDIRRDWHEHEEMVVKLATARDLPWALILTKSDKLNRRDFERQLRTLKKDSQASSVFPISALKGTGIPELQKFMFENWIAPVQNHKE
jgi:GTP-binding protein